MMVLAPLLAVADLNGGARNIVGDIVQENYHLSPEEYEKMSSALKLVFIEVVAPQLIDKRSHISMRVITQSLLEIVLARPEVMAPPVAYRIEIVDHGLEITQLSNQKEELPSSVAIRDGFRNELPLFRIEGSTANQFFTKDLYEFRKFFREVLSFEKLSNDGSSLDYGNKAQTYQRSFENLVIRPKINAGDYLMEADQLLSVLKFDLSSMERVTKALHAVFLDLSNQIEMAISNRSSGLPIRGVVIVDESVPVQKISVALNSIFENRFGEHIFRSYHPSFLAAGESEEWFRNDAVEDHNFVPRFLVMARDQIRTVNLSKLSFIANLSTGWLPEGLMNFDNRLMSPTSHVNGIDRHLSGINLVDYSGALISTFSERRIFGDIVLSHEKGQLKRVSVDGKTLENASIYSLVKEMKHVIDIKNLRKFSGEIIRHPRGTIVWEPRVKKITLLKESNGQMTLQELALGYSHNVRSCRNFLNR